MSMNEMGSLFKSSYLKKRFLLRSYFVKMLNETTIQKVNQRRSFSNL